MLQALVLGAVQGLTEFVPVSSSAHLTLVPFLSGWETPSLAFDVAVHLGTALAVITYFRRELVGLVASTARTVARRGDDRDRNLARLVLLLAVATLPAAGTGLLLEDLVDRLVHEPLPVALFLLGTAALLLGAEALYSRRDPDTQRDLTRVSARDAVAIGLMQALAIAPGISRSGATMSAGLARGLSRDAAARFSFLLGLPAIAGAGILKASELGGAKVGPLLAATALAGGMGFAAIAFLMRYLRTRTMRPFAWYCVALSIVSVGYWFQLR